MAAYLVVEIEIIDPEPYQRYIEQVPAVVYDHGGRYVTRTTWSPSPVDGRRTG